MASSAASAMDTNDDDITNDSRYDENGKQKPGFKYGRWGPFATEDEHPKVGWRAGKWGPGPILTQEEYEKEPQDPLVGWKAGKWGIKPFIVNRSFDHINIKVLCKSKNIYTDEDGNDLVDNNSYVERVCSYKFLKYSKLIKGLVMSSDFDLSQSVEEQMGIALINVSCQVFDIIVPFLEFYNDYPYLWDQHRIDTERLLNNNKEKLEKLKNKFEKDFFTPLYQGFDEHKFPNDKRILFEIILAANFLEFKPLVKSCCKQVMQFLVDKTPEQMRIFFECKADMTPEQIKTIEKELEWLKTD